MRCPSAWCRLTCLFLTVKGVASECLHLPWQVMCVHAADYVGS